MRAVCFILLFIASLFIVWFFLRLPAQAHLPDRPDLNGWISQLRSGPNGSGGFCCDFTEAEHLTDVEWETKDGHYRVYIDGQWYDVPDRAVVDSPNKYGPAIVWPDRYNGKVYAIRCFLPGAGS